MRDMLQKALALAERCHKGQVDKSGKPYILHPITVSLSEWILDDTQRAIALLHDTVEDTDLDLCDLWSYGFSKEVIEGVRLLTRENPKSQSYDEYIDSIIQSGNINAIRVKLADLEHNSKLSRLENPTEKDFKRVQKYNQAFDLLFNYLKWL